MGTRGTETLARGTAPAMATTGIDRKGLALGGLESDGDTVYVTDTNCDDHGPWLEWWTTDGSDYHGIVDDNGCHGGPVKEDDSWLPDTIPSHYRWCGTREGYGSYQNAWT